MTPRILIYSHDTFGLGHLRRCRTIARALVERFPRASVLIVSGSPIIGSYDFPTRVDFVRLPGVIKLSNGDYVARLPEEDVAATIRLRSELIDKVAQSFSPNLAIIDKEPLGVRGELAPALRRLKRGGARIVLGLRDILDEQETLATEWDRKRAWPALKSYYDEIWVYGLKSIYDPLQGLPVPPRLAAATVFTGYLRREVPPHGTPAVPPEAIARPFLLATTGGGGDGDGLIDWVLAAYEAGPMPLNLMLVLGPFLESTRAQAFLARAQRLTGVHAIVFDAFLEHLVERAAGVVAMGGYNTFCEILSLEKPALIVPRTAPRREQLIRAERAAELGLAGVLRDPADEGRPRDPAVMAAALRELPARRPPGAAGVQGLLDGLEIVCARTEHLLAAAAAAS